MKLDIPFYKQTTLLTCGPVALKMVLAYFGDKTQLKAIEERTGIKEGKAVSSIKLAIAAASLGYGSSFFSKSVLFNQENAKMEFYKKYAELDIEISKKLVEEAKKKGVMIKETTLSLNTLLSFLTKDSIPIVLIDWSIIKGKKEGNYQGHFVPVVGYDDKNTFIHNHGLSDTQESMPVERQLFDLARKAKGTDEDIVLIHRK